MRIHFIPALIFTLRRNGCQRTVGKGIGCTHLKICIGCTEKGCKNGGLYAAVITDRTHTKARNSVIHINVDRFSVRGFLVVIKFAVLMPYVVNLCFIRRNTQGNLLPCLIHLIGHLGVVGGRSCLTD